jgi:NADH dehydrogenase
MNNNIPSTNAPRIVVIGCGFGGLQLAKSLRNDDVQIVMLDKNNYHTFQPLLYQVSSAGLEADSIAYPIRKIFKGQKNFHFRWCEVKRVLPNKKEIETNVGNLTYDYLVIATGTTTNFFGIDGLAERAMPMKTVPEALNLRSLILQNFEKALLTSDLELQKALMTFVIVGAGPTGVELAGALSELKKHVLPEDYPELDLRKMRVLLIESGKEVLQSLLPENQQKSLLYLKELGVEVWLNVRVTKYNGYTVYTATGKEITTANLIWTAGVKGNIIEGFEENTIVRGRYLCNQFNQIEGYENIFAIGDVALQKHEEKYPNGHPQVAPVAMQQGQLLARNITNQLQQKEMKPFNYFDKGSMATIGRNKAVVQVGKMKFGGFFGWLVWMGLHLLMLVGFRNKIIVLINWIWNYLNYDRNIRLIIRPYEPKQHPLENT